MAILLFSLRGVPEDEANEIRVLLSEKQINFYETSAGNWGISMPALWLINEEELENAEKILNHYHQQRAITQREIYIQLKKEEGNKKLYATLIDNPIRFCLYIIAMVFIVYIYIKMLFEFGL